MIPPWPARYGEVVQAGRSTYAILTGPLSMARRTASLDLTLPPRRAATPAYQWLYASLRAEILEGRLRPGARVPGTRDLAAQYGLARGTVVAAFEQLRAEGYVEGAIGSGTYVSKVLPEELLHVGPASPRQFVQRAKPRRTSSAYAHRVSLFPAYEPRRTRAFRANVPPLDLFPPTRWARIATRRLQRLSLTLLLGCESMGYLPLREAVADYLARSRGVRCDPAQIAIVSGIQEALDLAARILLDPGDRVCMEDPGYIGAAAVLEAAGVKIRSIPVDDEGMQVRAAGLRGARMGYVTPAHQFPTGLTMSLARRLQLLEWAGQSGAMIFEDDYDSEYRYSGRPIPALQGLGRADHVLFAGSFSKVLFPSDRKSTRLNSSHGYISY